MKIFIIKKTTLFIALIFGLTSFAQNNAYEMMVNDVKVIVQPSNNDIVQIEVVIKGGVQNYGMEKQGIESLAMSALTECGTEQFDKNSFKDQLDKVSAKMSGTAGKDYATFEMNCIKSDLETVWPLYVQALTTPKFDEKEFARIKQDAINTVKATASQPDAAIEKMLNKIAYKNKDYAKEPGGTENTLAKLSAQETKNYFESILTKSRMLIVVVADMDRDDLKKKITELLAPIPDGLPFSLKKEAFIAKTNSFKAEKKELATNYIQGKVSGPIAGSTDFDPFSLAIRIFRQRYFLEVRTNNGLSYAPQSWFDGGATSSANISVSTTNPNKYIAVTNTLINKIKTQGFTGEELKNMKTQYVTRFYYAQETNQAQASSLVQNEVLRGDWQKALTINDDIKKVSLDDVNNAFKKYFSNITWVYQGNPSQANSNLFIANKNDGSKNLPKSKVTSTKKQ